MSVQQFISDQLGIPISEVKPESSIRLLCTDSLEMVYLIQELESKYGISISDEEAQHFNTVGDIMRYVVPN